MSNVDVGKGKKRNVKYGPKPKLKPKPNSVTSESPLAGGELESALVVATEECADDSPCTTAVTPSSNLYPNGVNRVTIENAELYHSASAPKYSKLKRDHQVPQPFRLKKLLSSQRSSSLDDKGLQPGQNKKNKRTFFLMCACLANFVVVMSTFVAVTAAYVLIATLQSDIASLSSECQTAEPGSFESRLNNFDSDILKFLQISLTELAELRESSSNRVGSLERDVTAVSNLATDINMILNNTNKNIITLRKNLNERIVDVSVVNNKIMIIDSNMSDVVDEVVRMTEDITNSSAIQLATDIQSFYVFESCDIVASFQFPFPSGTYRIGPTQDHYSLMNCSTSTVLTCNGISGQWRRVAYLNTNQTNIECPGNLQATTNPPSCRIFGSSPTCSSVFFSSDGLPYSQVCGRIEGSYMGSPDGFQTFPEERPDNPTIDDNYIDGISLTYGRSPRQHIWTFSAVVPLQTGSGCESCESLLPSYVDSNYSCELVTFCSRPGDPPCHPAELWSGSQCRGGGTFHNVLSQATTDDLEMRLCRDQPTSDEDIFITFIEIFVSTP